VLDAPSLAPTKRIGALAAAVNVGPPRKAMFGNDVSLPVYPSGIGVPTNLGYFENVLSGALDVPLLCGNDAGSPAKVTSVRGRTECDTWAGSHLGWQ
jgi:hypothetical protein